MKILISNSNSSSYLEGIEYTDSRRITLLIIYQLNGIINCYYVELIKVYVD